MKAILAERKTLLALLRQLRSDAGLTQAQLAARLQRDQTFVPNWREEALGASSVTIIRENSGPQAVEQLLEGSCRT